MELILTKDILDTRESYSNYIYILAFSLSKWRALSVILNNKHGHLHQIIISIKSWNSALKSFNTKARNFSFREN